MGVDFYATSSILVKPVPMQWRAAKELPDGVYDDPMYIRTDWKNFNMFFKTKESVSAECGRSYHGYGEFCKKLAMFNDGYRLDYMPNIDGIMIASDAQRCLDELVQLRKYFVSDDWVYSENDENNENNGIDEHTWFFKEFCHCLEVAANGGILRIS